MSNIAFLQPYPQPQEGQPRISKNGESKDPDLYVQGRLDMGEISVFDTQALLSGPDSNQIPLHTFKSSGDIPLKQVVPNPGDIPELVAVYRSVDEGSPHLSVELYDIQNMKSVGGWKRGSTPDTNPFSVTWSPKGKQLAMGLENGDIITFAPSTPSELKNVVPKPPALGDQRIASSHWLTNTEFYAEFVVRGYIPPEDIPTYSHYIVTSDPKARTAGDIKLNPPNYPLPCLRPHAQFVVTLRSWVNVRMLIFVGDSASSDIGLLGCLNDSTAIEQWCHLPLDEMSTPTVPMSMEMDDTILVGLELDLTNTEPYLHITPAGDSVEVPPPPILYVYASDGTVLAWQIVNTAGVPYPGMLNASSAAQESSQIGQQHLQSAPEAPKPSPFGSTPAAFSTTVPSSSGGAFSAFANAPSKFGQTAFSSSASISPTPAPQASASSITDDAMDSEFIADAGLGGMSLGGGDDNGKKPSGQGSSGMFGSFAAVSPPAQGSTTSGTGSAFAPSSQSAFNGLKPAVGFGAFVNQTSNNPSIFTSGSSAFSSTPAPATTSDLKPASGFGQPAFGQQSALGKPGFSQPAFGQSGFAKSTTAQPAFGQTGFGQPALGQSAFSQSPPAQSAFSQPAPAQSAFGQPAFGQPAFGRSGFATAANPPTQSAGAAGPSSVGFSAFAQSPASGFASFAAKADAKPVWATSSGGDSAMDDKDSGQKTQFSTSAPALSAAEQIARVPSETMDSTSEPAAALAPATPSTGAFGQLKTTPSAFGQSVFGQSAFGKPAFGQPAFGQPAFAQPVTGPQTSQPTPGTGVGSTNVATGSAFAAYAQSGASFSSASSQPAAKPVWSASTSTGDQPSAKSSETTREDAKSTAGINNATQEGKRAESQARDTPDTTKPSQSGSSAPTGTGAFSQLKTSPYGFSHIGAGFGAFGAIDTSSSFFKAAKAPSSSPAGSTAPALALASTTPPSTPPKAPADAAKPTFGSPSPLGAARSVFGPSAAPPRPEVIPVVKSAFAAFSGTNVGFGSAPSSGKSFGDMLREKTEVLQDEKSNSASASTAKSNAPVSFFAQREAQLRDKGKEREAEPWRREADYEHALEQLEGDGDDDDDDDDVISFLSHSSVDGEGSEEDEEEEDDEDHDGTEETVEVSSVPQAVVTSTEEEKISPTPATSTPSMTSSSSLTKPAGTTPPGNPTVAKGTLPIIAPSSPAPVAPSLGLGRPSTRPARSSPLASQPINGDEDTDDTGATSDASGSQRFVDPAPIHVPVTAASDKAPTQSVFTPQPKPGPAGRAPLQSPSPSLSLFPGPQMPPLLPGGDRVPQAQPNITPTAPVVEEGMQMECMRLFSTLAREMEKVNSEAQQAAKLRVLQYQPGSGSRTMADLNEPKKWTLADTSRLKLIGDSLEKQLSALRNEYTTLMEGIHELESQFLRASMRKEEIVRFSKASMDAEFARMLKARTLGPEHLETQSHLRRDIRNLREKIQQLEEQVEAAKKRLSRLKTGKAAVMICRNIDVAIEQQREKVTGLSTRSAKVNPQPRQITPSPGEKSLEKSPASHSGTTPNVATSTAAALNAEMSASKLKRALLKVRKQPLLNTQAATTKPRHVDYTPQTPVRTPAGQPSLFAGLTPFTPGQSSTPIAIPISTTPAATPTPTAPDSFPAPTETDFPFSPSSPEEDYGAGTRRRTTNSRYHAKPVQFKKSSTSPSPAAKFEWGPLPSFASTTPQKTLPLLGGG
ncbi:predicted protein [Postia placenta Mad-698-R]|uniref:Nucleoporin Nup159/Nup146 N-terminal domain-containing protein n=1 Tax=Postia placenta MAD-698-R-SB12 TaxID=670580 RepID=A0A1X6N7X8_9APHY|nr:hypothetical protein POSPLADRAFT_1044167 [Postia placenta MAD-698-R-SB12]EED81972.1 predicted protein [Postia placenta Mad-698-R]OSX64684.1 hypothetical protein POSPLADRAFT_1044167 [Postia placenta MAD-698-R-SB12]